MDNVRLVKSLTGILKSKEKLVIDKIESSQPHDIFDKFL